MFEIWHEIVNDADITCNIDYFCDSDEVYNNPNISENIIQFSGQASRKVNSVATENYPNCYITNRLDTQWRVALYITSDGVLTSLHTYPTQGTYGVRWSCQRPPAQNIYYDYGSIPQLSRWETTATEKVFTFSTNIPFFGTDQTHAQAYVECTDDTQAKQLLKTYAYNYKEEETSPDGDMLEITNMWTYGIWLNDTQPQVTDIYFRNFRGKMTGGEFALYPINGLDDNKLKMGIKNNASFVDMEYSTDGQTWTSTDTFPFDFFYRRRVNELSPNANTYIGYALSFSNSKIPEFADETTAQGYIDGTVDITQATNWDNISANYPIGNGTADLDDASTMGQVFTRAFFSQQYICSESALQQISNAMFDTTQGGITGMFEDIKKGLEMYGESVIDAVQGLMFFPINLTTVFANTQSQSYIYFGGYKFDLQDSVTVNKIIYPNGYYDFGSFDLKPTFNNFRDYSPFQRLFCYLPYCGWVELDIARYINKTVNVRYYFDTRTGGCLACLFAGNVLVDYFNGQCGVQMPIKLADYSAYANAQIQTLLGGGKTPNGTGGAVGDMVGAGARGVMGGLAESGAIGLGTMAVGSVGVVGGIQATKTLYGLTQNNINNFNKTKGASTSMLNQYLPQEVCFMFEIQDADITPNELSLLGYPSNASGRLQDFSGYLEIDVVNLSCPYASDTEKAEIVKQLQNGVYI